MKGNTGELYTFEVLDEDQSSGQFSDVLVECRNKDGESIAKEWVTILDKDVPSARYTLVGPSQGPLRILKIKDNKQMASYIKFPVIFPTKDWNPGKGIVLPVATGKVFLTSKDNAPDWAVEAFEGLDRFVKRKGKDSFVEVMMSFDESKGDVGEKGVYLNLDSKTKPTQVEEDDYENQGDLADPEIFLELLVNQGYTGELYGETANRKPVRTALRPARDTSGGGRRNRKVEDEEDDEGEIEETPKKKVVIGKTKSTDEIVTPAPQSPTNDREALQLRVELLVRGVTLLMDQLEDVDVNKALELVSMQLCNIANGGKIA